MRLNSTGLCDALLPLRIAIHLATKTDRHITEQHEASPFLTSRCLIGLALAALSFCSASVPKVAGLTSCESGGLLVSGCTTLTSLAGGLDWAAAAAARGSSFESPFGGDEADCSTTAFPCSGGWWRIIGKNRGSATEASSSGTAPRVRVAAGFLNSSSAKRSRSAAMRELKCSLRRRAFSGDSMGFFRGFVFVAGALATTTGGAATAVGFATTAAGCGAVAVGCTAGCGAGCAAGFAATVGCATTAAGCGAAAVGCTVGCGAAGCGAGFAATAVGCAARRKALR
jgi:hypothetical protein